MKEKRFSRVDTFIQDCSLAIINWLMFIESKSIGYIFENYQAEPIERH